MSRSVPLFTVADRSFNIDCFGRQICSANSQQYCAMNCNIDGGFSCFGSFYSITFIFIYMYIYISVYETSGGAIALVDVEHAVAAQELRSVRLRRIQFLMEDFGITSFFAAIIEPRPKVCPDSVVARILKLLFMYQSRQCAQGFASKIVERVVACDLPAPRHDALARSVNSICARNYDPVDMCRNVCL